ncbi:MAG: single-stranded-DNA-specific exonuclease RecJ [bacterium]|nr:single-stranded-DNA-specific exonuclease RecJ [bacterium]
MNARWKMKPVVEEAVQRLAQETGLSLVIARLLSLRGLGERGAIQQFLDPSPRFFHDPFLFSEMETAVGRILEAVQAKERILIHGDYDVDGITSICIMLETLTLLGCPASYFIPCRLTEGYGLQTDKIEEFSQAYDLMITVDCGTTACEAVELANRAGLDVIITDHHDPGPRRPEALAVINPSREEETYPFSSLCGAGVAWKLATALLQKAGRSQDQMALLELAALGTVADVVPLQGENRLIVALGMQRLQTCERPGLFALMDLAKVIPAKIDTEALAFRIGPRINAAGRMGNVDVALNLLYTRDETEAWTFARELHQMNMQRQAIEKQVMEEACHLVEENRLHSRSDHILFVAGKAWHSGVLGIVAARLQQKYGKSVFLLSVEEQTAQGSARGRDGVDLIPLLDAVRPHALSCGGHASAAGMRVEEKNLPVFEKALYEAAAIHCSEVVNQPLWLDAALSLEQIDHQLMAELQRLQPFGEGNPEPVFYAKASMNGYGARIVGNGHLKLSLQHPRGIVDAIGFNLGYKLETLGGEGSPIELAFRCRYNEFQGKKSIDLNLLDIRSAAIAAATATIPSKPQALRPAVAEPKAGVSALDRTKLGEIYRLLKKSANEAGSLTYNNVFLFAQLTKTSKADFETALQIFAELQFLKIENGKIFMLEPDQKRNLTESATFRKSQPGQ